jgi:hypothetical protein
MTVATRAVFTGGFPTVPPRTPVELVALFNGTSNAGPYAIGSATSDDEGISWTVNPSNPVLQKGAGGTWDDDHVKDPWLMRMSDGTFVCYYSGYDGAKYQTGRATASSIEGPWTKYASNPVLTVGAGGAFDDTNVVFPTVLYDPDASPPWKMWYGGNDGSIQRIGYAHSTDGLSWTKHGMVIDVGAGGTWNDEGVLPGAILRFGTTYYLYVGGRTGTTNPQWEGGLYTFTSPTGTYTAASNPILLARYHDAGVFQTLTTNTALGSAVVAITSTAAYTVNEPMALADANSETHIASIASIDSGTQITLDAVTSAAFTTAQGAVIRPFASNSVLPRTVYRTADGWVMYFSPFQPVEDLSPGGSKLREGSMRATSPDADGTWAYDYTAGLLFPVDGAGWDALSAENPSVVGVD